MSLLVTGTVAVDSVQTPFGVADNVLGGSASYFSVAASYFSPVRLVGVVGDDFPSEYREVFAGRDIDLAGLETRDGSKTFRWTGSYTGSMDEAETRETHLNVLTEEGPRVPSAFRDTEYVFLANYHPAVQKSIIASLDDPKLVVADTMNFWIDNERQGLLEVLSEIDGLLINQGEAVMLTGQHNTTGAGRDILEMGPGFVIIKKGEHGCLLVTPDETCMLPAWPVEEVRDPTGAGDSFGGGLMGYLAERGGAGTSDLRRAAAYGTVTASFAIQDFSLNGIARASRPEIDEACEAYKRMLRID